MPDAPPFQSFFPRRLAGALFSTAAILAMMPDALSAQSTGDLAAWNALVVSPVGALPPRVRNGLFGDSLVTELSLHYGRWRYDMDDAIHNNLGVTAARQLGAARTDVAVTAGYLSVSCGSCAAWISAGVEAQQRLLQRDIAGDSVRPVEASLGVRVTAGAARYVGQGGAMGSSVTGAAEISVAFPAVWSSRAAISVMPGLGIGRFSSVDETAYGTRPMLGAALAWSLRNDLMIDVGMQRIYITDGPTQLGAGLTWRTR
jgi:hypothetical protein